MERKVNEIFILNGKRYLVQERKTCLRCAFNFENCEEYVSGIGFCSEHLRSDKRNVFFKELKSNIVLNSNPFDLELAKQGYAVQTRTGKKVRILCFDAKIPNYPIVTLITLNDNLEKLALYTNEGKFFHDNDEDCEYDLVMYAEKQVRWMNLYKVGNEITNLGPTYESKESALANKHISLEYVATVSIEYKV